MQSNKTSSRKPRETAANAAGQLSEGNATAPAKKARATVAATSSSKSSKAAAPATRHRRAVSDPLASSDDAVVALPNNEASFTEAAGAKTAPKAMAASAAGAGVFRSDVVESVGQSTEPRTLSREEIAALAHAYWLERGGQHGAHEEDWFRAEQELKAGE